MKRLFSISIITIVLDQLVKIIVANNMSTYQSINIINNFFSITFAKNIGAAWSILSGSRIFLIIIAIFVLGLIYFLFIKNKELKKSEEIIYGLLIGGIVGNLIDRIVYGYVIDYLDFNILGYDYPIFNIADICIVVSIFCLIIIILKGEKHDSK